MWKARAPWQRLPDMKETHSDKFYTPDPSYASTWAPASTSMQKRKMNGKELHTHICSLTAMMDEEEKEKFYDEAEKEGF